jgi:hypothetical protein
MSRVLRQLVAAVAVVAAAAAVVGVIGLPVYVFPPQVSPPPADVVYVIGPPKPWRLELGEQLIREGLADSMVVSVYDVGVPFCTEEHDFDVLCIHPEPFTTQGEARAIRDLMAENSWDAVTVITTTPHIVRTRLRMEHCVPDGITVIGRATGLDLSGWLYQYTYQTLAFAKAWATPEC